MESFLARLSNHDPMEVVDRLLTADRLENVLDFCSILMSIMRGSSSGQASSVFSPVYVALLHVKKR